MAKPIRVLYIEDDRVAAIYALRNLNKSGYVIDLARNGKEGLSKLEKNYYHLPDMNGLEVLRELAKSYFQVPAIMITGEGDEKVAVEAMKLGAGDYLVKDRTGNYIDQLPFVSESFLEKQRLI